MEIKHENGKFTAVDGNKSIGEMTYRNGNDGGIIIDHTEVEPAHEGKGIGNKLVEAAVQKARSEGFKIEPQCSFARKLFEKNTGWQDVLSA